LQGKNQFEISEQLHISQSTVSRDLKSLLKTWDKESAETWPMHRAREFAKINEMERIYYEEWKCSKVAPPAEDGEDPPQELPGNPAFLYGAKDCVKMRISLFGVNAPQLLTMVDEDFDQVAWAKERDRRHAQAAALLDQAEDAGAED